MDFAACIFSIHDTSENPGRAKNKAIDYIKSMNITGMKCELLF
jgi:hypothetical protein